MAEYLSDRPFSGVRQMKYEQMLSERPDAVKEMSNEDLEQYLLDLEDTYRSRTMELLEPCMDDEGATEELKATDWAAYNQAVERAQRRARELALAEMMES